MSEWPIDIDAIYSCHLWRGPCSPNGYPVLFSGGRKSAHRVAYERARGLIAADLVIDHLCRRRDCVNPIHLEAVTRHENELRKSWAYRCKRKRCALGHDLSTAVVTPEMGRLCRTCATGARKDSP